MKDKTGYKVKQDDEVFFEGKLWRVEALLRGGKVRLSKHGNVFVETSASNVEVF
jgi:hypothetical protein